MATVQAQLTDEPAPSPTAPPPAAPPPPAPPPPPPPPANQPPAAPQPVAQAVAPDQEVRNALERLCERTEGSIVKLQDIIDNISDDMIVQLGGMQQVRSQRSRRPERRVLVTKLVEQLKLVFDVAVMRNDTGLGAGQRPFKGYYADNLRMRDRPSDV